MITLSTLLKEINVQSIPKGQGAWKLRVRQFTNRVIIWLQGLGGEVNQIAAILGISLRTCWRSLQGEFKIPGRPQKKLAPEVRARIKEELKQMGGRVSVDFLKYKYKSASRSAIGALKKTWVREHEAEKRAAMKHLAWKKAGRVWSLDGAHTGVDIEQKGKRILVMRDLGSGYTLGVAPAPETSRDVIHFLQEMFAEYGRPLVIKHDGGSGFIAGETSDYLLKKGVTALLSPPAHPQYNGAIERGMQDIKAFTEAAAFLSGRLRNWLQIDLQMGMNMANERKVERGGKWVSAQMRFAERKPVSDLERVMFQITSDHETNKRKKAIKATFTLETTEKKRQSLLKLAARLGVTRALTDGGYLTIEEGRVSQPVSEASCATISEG